jgi:hypothetical protein
MRVFLDLSELDPAISPHPRCKVMQSSQNTTIEKPPCKCRHCTIIETNCIECKRVKLRSSYTEKGINPRCLPKVHKHTTTMTAFSPINPCSEAGASAAGVLSIGYGLNPSGIMCDPCRRISLRVSQQSSSVRVCRPVLVFHQFSRRLPVARKSWHRSVTGR